MKKILSIAFLAAAVSACCTKTEEIPGIKDFIKDDFKIGVAVGPRTVEGLEGEMILKHFTTMTAENVMKPASVIQQDGSYDFTVDGKSCSATVNGGTTTSESPYVLPSQSIA